MLEVLSLACPALTIRPGMAEVWHQVIGSTFHGFETLTVSMLKVAAKRAAQRSSLPSAADVVTEVRYLAQLDREYSEWTSETGADDASRADR